MPTWGCALSLFGHRCPALHFLLVVWHEYNQVTMLISLSTSKHPPDPPCMFLIYLYREFSGH